MANNSSKLGNAYEIHFNNSSHVPIILALGTLVGSKNTLVVVVEVEDVAFIAALTKLCNGGLASNTNASACCKISVDGI
eukprot:8206343-Ditylum_brightwellii.AAC.1